MALSPERVVQEAVALLSPLPSYFASADNAGELFRRLGYDPSPSALASVALELEALGDAVNALVEDAAAFAAQAAETARRGAFLDLVAATKKVWDRLRDLPQHASALGLTPSAVDDLFGLLLVDHLLVEHPALLRSLVLLGIIESADVPSGGAGGAQLSHTRVSIHWEQCAKFLQDPSGWAAATYGWGTEVFEHDLALVRLSDLVDACGQWTTLLDMPPALVARLCPSLAGAQVSPLAVRLPLHRVDTDEGEAGVEVGLLAMPVEGKQAPTASDIGLAVMPYTAGVAEGTLAVTPEVDLIYKGSAAAAGVVVFAIRPHSGLEVSGGGTAGGVPSGAVRLELRRKPPAQSRATVLLGDADGSRLEAATLWCAVGGDGDFFLLAGLEDFRLVIDLAGDKLLGQIVPPSITIGAREVVVEWRSGSGIRFRGAAALEVTVPVHVSLFGVLTVDRVYLAVRARTAEIELVAAVTVAVKLGPIDASFEQIGIRAALLSPPGGGNLGPVELGVAFKPPDGAGLLIDAGPVTGGGVLARSPGPPERFAGALALRLTRFAVTAFGVFERTPGGRIAFVAVLGVRFFPGLQLGFGFALTGVGGLVGINRRADADALRERLITGAAANVLFTDDPVANAPTLLGDLTALFPVADGIVVVGPTLQVSWLTLARFDVGIVLELPGPSRVLLLGTARLQIGGEGGVPALLYIRLDVLGEIDFVHALVAFDAALVNSQLLQIFQLTGTAAFRLSTGDRPYVILTVGGFHPAFNPEPNVLPPQQRVGLAMDVDVGVARLWLRLDAYVAATSNTFQVGAAFEMGVQAGPFDALGSLGFDALIQFRPFYFSVGLFAGLRIRAFGFTLAGVDFSGTLSGPGPLVLSGSFSIQILFWEIRWRDAFTLGEDAGERLAPVNSLLDALAPELTKPENLQAADAEEREVALVPRRVDPALVVVMPQGQLAWSQKRAPLGVALDRFEGVPLRRPQVLVVQSPDGQGALQDWFSPGTFRDLSESEALNQKAFVRLDSGVRVGYALAQSPPIDHDSGVETVRLPCGPGTPRPAVALQLATLPAVLLAAAARRREAGRALPAAAVLGLRDETWNVRGSDGAVLARGLTESDAHQRARAAAATALPALDAHETLDLAGV